MLAPISCLHATHLNHKLADNAVEYDIVVIAVSCMSDKILDGLGRHVRKESDVDVPVSGMDNGCSSRLRCLLFRVLTLAQISRLLVLNVSTRFAYPSFVSTVRTPNK
jgi:hypothetical protein